MNSARTKIVCEITLFSHSVVAVVVKETRKEKEKKKKDKEITATWLWSVSALVKQETSISPWGISNYIFLLS